MSQLAEKFSGLLPPGDAGSEPRWLTGLRENGIEAFRRLGLPNKKVEQWKYATLHSLERRNPSLGDPAALPEVGHFPEPLADLPVTLGMSEGQLTSIEGRLPEGVRVWPLRDALEEDGRGFRNMLEALEFDKRGQGFAALNTAALGGGLVIHVAARAKAGALLVQWSGGGEDAVLFNSRVLLTLEEGAELHLVEQFENGPGDTSILNVVAQHSLARDAALSHTRLQQQSARSFLVTRTEVTQAKGSRFRFTGLDLGDGFARHDVRTSLNGPGTACALNGACITAGESLADHHLEVVHAAEDCESSQLFRAVADGRSRVVFNGRVLVREGADGTDASQSSAGLLLSQTAEIDAKPELEIYADEVIASHGATVGQLDEDALFYLQSRGLGRAEARNLLTMAFCRSVTDQLPLEALRETLGERLTMKLSAAGAGCA